MFRPALLLSLIAGCYRPSVESCQYTCSATQACPDGLACTNNQCAMPGDTCTGGDAAVPDAFVPTPCDNTFCVEASGTVKNLNALWGTGPNDLWAVGDGGIVLHRTGTDAWDLVGIGPGPVTANLNDISGRSGTTGDALVIAGDAGNIVMFDGQQWSINLIANNPNLYGALAVASSTDWVVGAAGTVYAHAVGEAWQDLSLTEAPEPAITADLYAITIAGVNELAIAGVGQRVYRRSPVLAAGVQWTSLTTGLNPSSAFVELYAPPLSTAIWGLGPRGADQFTPTPPGWKSKLAGDLADMDGQTTDLWAAGAAGVAHATLGGNLSFVVNGPLDLRGVAVFGHDVFFVGTNGRIYHYRDVRN